MKLSRRLMAPFFAVIAAASLMALEAPAAHAFTPPSSQSNCGGTVVFKADGSLWQCTFDDEFSGTRIDPTKWSVPTTFLSGNVANIYSCTPNDPRIESVSNGALHLTALELTTPTVCNTAYAPTNWIAGTVTTNGHFSQTYGRWEARVRAPLGVTGGFNEQFWMYPDPKYTLWTPPSSGEIDVSQQFSWWPTYYYPALHYGTGTWLLGTNYQACAAQRGVWNTYDLIWTPTSLTFQINGQTCLVNTAADPAFTKPFFINLSEALFNADSTTQGSATMDVDYVRVWK